jgi:branched-chain amino acid transport system permease protein
MLRVVNFAHGSLYMLGAFGAVLLARASLDLWAALVVVPIVVAAGGMLLERLFVHRLARLDPLYNFLLTFGLALVFQDLVRMRYGVQSQHYGDAPFRGRSTWSPSPSPPTRCSCWSSR